MAGKEQLDLDFSGASVRPPEPDKEEIVRHKIKAGQPLNVEERIIAEQIRTEEKEESNPGNPWKTH